MESYHDNTEVYNKLYSSMIKLVPQKACKVSEFPEKLNSALKEYERVLRAFEESSNNKEGKIELEVVEEIIKSITSATEAIYEGKPALAFSYIKDTAWRFEKLVYDIPENTSFYRMRSIEGVERASLACKDMFHIPFDKRGIVSTQRYSIPGYPCLYLGEAVFGCWKELGQPNLDSCMVSRLINKKILKVWDLRVPEKTKWKDRDVLSSNIRLFPLVVACMFKVKDSKAVFKHEYIIPQLLLQIILENNTIDGIMYTSVHKNNDFKFPDFVDTNYVFPIKEQGPDFTHCPQLCDIFRITKPTSEEYEKIKRGTVFGEDNIKIEIPEGLTKAEQQRYYNYEMSLFGCLERNLKNIYFFGLHKINPMRKKG